MCINRKGVYVTLGKMMMCGLFTFATLRVGEIPLTKTETDS